ncbi:uncharacterized protein PHALS_14946 [Plasmopara halstedii]|uniref:Uncharacterized protein n=1 Tax=Plasmopara halstedii TaxID=4781 RepID=A0A0P1A650_PLAHL|nr:uncharacterized protein PHALS_14946 [Plasmopara halstedii]CEG36047.1 hypothetical protein PHALS_14946 [Plasmopara halstedii]|eukprot:XP_024572416.1 hypothetical protein PHALS_14946 [Plasmopara halstedii]
MIFFEAVAIRNLLMTVVRLGYINGDYFELVDTIECDVRMLSCSCCRLVTLHYVEQINIGLQHCKAASEKTDLRQEAR